MSGNVHVCIIWEVIYVQPGISIGIVDEGCVLEYRSAENRTNIGILDFIH